MKVIIIGGGIAGLALGTLLHRKGIEMVVCDRFAKLPDSGMAFLMHNDGLEILKEIRSTMATGMPGQLIKAFHLMRPNGEEIKHIKIDPWRCITRNDLMQTIYDTIPPVYLQGGREFSHFVYENEKIVAAAFTNGEIEYGDLFVGADGGNSAVRDAIFGPTAYTDIEVNEILGVVKDAEIVAEYAGVLTKFQDARTGLSFGFIPSRKDELVWYSQFDHHKSGFDGGGSDEIERFCRESLKDFPPIVKRLLDLTDFKRSYLWKTKDFDPLPRFHKDNVVLIGDAAHLVLPFTSAGTTNALIDAKTLAQCIEVHSDSATAFQTYYESREETVSAQIEYGRSIKKTFLEPERVHNDDIPVPLISQKAAQAVNGSKPIRILYFTDPICSTCWIIQPQLRKLQLEFGPYFEIDYCMGGLLPSWDMYESGKINSPTDAAKHWDDVCTFYDMPLDGEVWLEDPLPSSFPPSIAFKAAQMQDRDKAVLFLRRIKEMVFLEKKNIIKWEYLRLAAFELGLDSARLLRDFEGRAREHFEADLALAKRHGVTGFPTLFFSNLEGKEIRIKGFQPYERFEQIIRELCPDLLKQEVDLNPENLFRLYSTMTTKEFSILTNLPMGTSFDMLNELEKSGKIAKYQSRKGIIWISQLEREPVV